MADALLPAVRDLLSAETQQIREERDCVKFEKDALEAMRVKGNKYLIERVEQAEAETQALREALEKVSTLALEATNGWACYATRKIEHDEIARLHKGIDAARLTPASTRTGEKVEPENPSGTTSASSDDEGPLSRHFIRVKL